MDRPGGIPGGVICRIKNVHSGITYVISTCPELGQDYWSIAIIPLKRTRVLWGLWRRSELDLEGRLVLIRNSGPEAYSVHQEVKPVVASVPEEDWFNRLPPPSPPQGHTPGAMRRITQALTDPNADLPPFPGGLARYMKPEEEEED